MASVWLQALHRAKNKHSRKLIAPLKNWKQDAFFMHSQMDASKAAAALGKRGGKVKSPAKAAAARENGKLGGRPRKVKPE